MSSARLDVRGTPFVTLAQLYRSAGTATVGQLASAVLCSQYQSVNRFHQTVLRPLELRGLITQAEDLVVITQHGRLTVEQHKRPERVLAHKTDAPELDLARFYASGPSRPGALDYRSYPSLVAGQRIPYWFRAA